MIKKVSAVNQFGDFSCPHCFAMFINPLNCELKPGVTNCQFCGRKFEVTIKAAEIANKNSRKYNKALERVIKELKGA